MAGARRSGVRGLRGPRWRAAAGLRPAAYRRLAGRRGSGPAGPAAVGWPLVSGPPAAGGIRPRGLGEPGPGSVADQAAASPGDSSPGISMQLSPAAAGDVAAAVLDRQLLLRACALLPVQQRAVLVLRFWEDRSVQETAAVLGCTEGTVKSHTHRALARLRLALQEAPALRGGPPEGSAMLTDHDLQTELAAAFREQADPVTGMPSIPLGSSGGRARQAAPPGGGARSLGAGRRGGGGGCAGGEPGGGRSLALPSRLAFSLTLPWPPAPAARAAVSGMPPYYVTADHGRPLAEVRDSATGKTLSVVPLPAGSTRRCPRSPRRAMTTPSSSALFCHLADPVLPDACRGRWPFRPADPSAHPPAARGGGRGRDRGQPRRPQACGSQSSSAAASAGRLRSCRWPPARCGGGPPAGPACPGTCPGPMVAASWGSSGRTTPGADRRGHHVRACGCWTPPRREAT